MTGKYDLMDDNQLIILISQANEAALTSLYNRYYVLLCRSAFKRLPEESVVEELVQDVFINLWNKAASLDHAGNIKSYLFATLRNKVLHEIRASIAVARHAAVLSRQDAGYAPDAIDLLHSRDLEHKFQSVVMELPPQCREAFTLSRFENLSYKSIADRMDISVNTVEKHVGKALSILRKSFREYDVILPVMILLHYLRK